MKFKSITSCEEYICFTQASSLSDANGIMYIPNIKQFDEKMLRLNKLVKGGTFFMISRLYHNIKNTMII